MKYTDIKSSTGQTYGVNMLTLESIEYKPKTDANDQMEIVFSAPGYPDADGNPTVKRYRYWHNLIGELKPKMEWKLSADIKRFINVCAVVHGEQANNVYDSISASAPEFEPSDANSVSKFEFEFIKRLLQDVIGKEVPVVLHWKGGYLNVPNLKVNDWNLPFGVDPVVGENLNKVKDTEGEEEQESKEETVQNW